jgi:pentatricopeptide repeat protein
MERTEDGFSVELLSFKNHGMLYGVLLASDLGRRLTREGVDIKPNWANGAKVLFPTRASALPSDFVAKLRPYHVLARAHDVPEVVDALRCLSYKQAPRHSGEEDDRVPLSFVIDKTFVRVPEPCELTPRSSFTKSTNDARKCYTNPRARDHRFDGYSFAGAASSGTGSHVAHSFQEHLAEMKICQANRDLHLAIQCYSQMLADELQPDVQVFTIIIDLCAKTGNCEEAERWIRTMKDNHVKPNVVSFNCLISGYAHLGNAAKAEEWYQELLRAELHPSLVTYNCLIKAFTQSGCVEKAEEWLKTADGNLGSDTLSYAPFIQYFAHKGLPRKAEEWFNRMSHHGLAPDSETFGMMVAAAANAKDLELARLWADRMQEAGHQLQVYEYTQLLKACCPHDDSPGRKLYDEASAVFHDQVRSGVTPNLFNLNALQSAVGRERALVLCERLQVDVEAAEREFKYMKEELGVKGWMIGKIGKDGAFRRKHSAPDYEHAE